MKTFSKVFGWLCIATVLGLGVTLVAFPASITQLAGLAVAQTSTQWNQLKDMAVGDGQSSGAMLASPCLWNGLTCDRQRGSIANGAQVDITRIGGAVTPTDTFTNPTTTNVLWVLNSIWNGTTWDRMRAATADALVSTGLQAAPGMLFNGSTWDRARTATADNLAVTGIPTAGNMGFDGATWDRATSISNTNNTATTSQGVRYSTPLSTWSVTNTPAVATQATASRALGGGTVRHVATGVTLCIAANATAQVPILVHLRDGATGAGTILRTWAISKPIGNSGCENVTGLNMTGSANTAMTLETAAATAAGVQGTVTLTGYSTP